MPEVPLDVLKGLDQAIEALRRWRRAVAGGPEHIEISIAYLETLRLNLIRPKAA